MANPPDRLLTVDQAAEIVGCHPETIRRAIRRGWLVATRDRLGRGAPWTITRRELRRFTSERIIDN